MSKTHKYRTVLSGEGITTARDKTVEVTGDGHDGRSVQITSGNDRNVLIAFTLAALKGYYIVSDQDLTLETNSSSAADDTIAMVANKPLVWYDGCGYDKHFTADVTTLYFSNAGATTANLTIDVLKDATP